MLVKDADVGKSLCSASRCGGIVDEELFSKTRKNNKRTILISTVHSPK